LNPYLGAFLLWYSAEAQSYGNDFKRRCKLYGKMQNLAPLKFQIFNALHFRRISHPAISTGFPTCSAWAAG
jgi:hypothetical protein